MLRRFQKKKHPTTFRVDPRIHTGRRLPGRSRRRRPSTALQHLPVAIWSAATEPRDARRFPSHGAQPGRRRRFAVASRRRVKFQVSKAPGPAQRADTTSAEGDALGIITQENPCPERAIQPLRTGPDTVLAGVRRTALVLPFQGRSSLVSRSRGRCPISANLLTMLAEYCLAGISGGVSFPPVGT